MSHDVFSLGQQIIRGTDSNSLLRLYDLAHQVSSKAPSQQERTQGGGERVGEAPDDLHGAAALLRLVEDGAEVCERFVSAGLYEQVHRPAVGDVLGVVTRAVAARGDSVLRLPVEAIGADGVVAIACRR